MLQVSVPPIWVTSTANRHNSCSIRLPLLESYEETCSVQRCPLNLVQSTRGGRSYHAKIFFKTVPARLRGPTIPPFPLMLTPPCPTWIPMTYPNVYDSYRKKTWWPCQPRKNGLSRLTMLPTKRPCGTPCSRRALACNNCLPTATSYPRPASTRSSARTRSARPQPSEAPCRL